MMTKIDTLCSNDVTPKPRAYSDFIVRSIFCSSSGSSRIVSMPNCLAMMGCGAKVMLTIACFLGLRERLDDSLSNEMLDCEACSSSLVPRRDFGTALGRGVASVAISQAEVCGEGEVMVCCVFCRLKGEGVRKVLASMLARGSGFLSRFRLSRDFACVSAWVMGIGWSMPSSQMGMLCLDGRNMTFGMG